ncbi:MAG: haloacid dehalogenase [Chlorobiaceae bacterium]|nr:haloacid dehalogenase [Chlorobiaceae bacterium]NTW10046.1 haloacid dehalogenase [Chlorobiaceae bacterium]
MGVVLLDIGNVIVDVDFHRFCLAVSIDGEQCAETLFRRYCSSEEKNRFDRGLIAPGEYLGLIARDPEVRPMPSGELKELWQDIFSPKKGVEEAVELLRQKHRLWIMSDTDPLHFVFLLNNFPVLKQAERYWLSYEHGRLKSQPESFIEVLNGEVQRSAADFMLLDDREDNCRSAESCGIRAHRFTAWPLALEDVRMWES